MKRNNGLDLLKAICAFMVVCIHAPFPGVLGSIITPLTRVAVPIFFMVTGYYYSCTKERSGEKKQLGKIFRLFLGANLLYFVFSLLKSIASGISAATYLKEAFSLKSALKLLCLNVSPFAGHLWYLGAILYVLLIVFVFEKKWDRQKLYPLIPVLLLTDLVLGKYSLLLFGREFSVILVRNFLFVGLPYFLIGDMLYRRKTQMQAGKALLFTLLFACTTLAERFLLGAACVNAERDHYLSTTFLAVFLFLLAVQRQDAFGNKVSGLLCHIGGKLSTDIYIAHPILIAVFSMGVAFVSRYVPVKTAYSYVAPLVVFAVTAVASQLWKIAVKKLKKPTK